MQDLAKRATENPGAYGIQRATSYADASRKAHANERTRSAVILLGDYPEYLVVDSGRVAAALVAAGYEYS